MAPKQAQKYLKAVMQIPDYVLTPETPEGFAKLQKEIEKVRQQANRASTPENREAAAKHLALLKAAAQGFRAGAPTQFVRAEAEQKKQSFEKKGRTFMKLAREQVEGGEEGFEIAMGATASSDELEMGEKNAMEGVVALQEKAKRAADKETAASSGAKRRKTCKRPAAAPADEVPAPLAGPEQNNEAAGSEEPNLSTLSRY